MDASLYFPVFMYSVTLLCVLAGMRLFTSNGYEMQEKGNRDLIIPLLLCIIYIFFLGNRPLWSNYFGDTGNYSRTYMILDLDHIDINWKEEWIWSWLMITCKSLGLSASDFFTIVELGYFGTTLWTIKRLTPDNVFLCLMFVLSSLMFYTFGVNGIRNGLGCHIILLGITYMFTGNYTIGGILFAVAYGIHKSTILPIASCLAAIFLIKDVKWAIYFWLFSIVLSFFAGGFFTNFFASLGFDDRMSSYAADSDFSLFSRTGFRWDFLLYSSMPVLMTWYVCIKRQISDNWYNALAITYCLCNAFWVLVIRSSYSNRFAYLSWFLYPFIIAYPLIMLPIWDDQDHKTAIILFLYVGFTLIMNYIWHNF